VENAGCVQECLLENPEENADRISDLEEVLLNALTKLHSYRLSLKRAQRKELI